MRRVYSLGPAEAGGTLRFGGGAWGVGGVAPPISRCWYASAGVPADGMEGPGGVGLTGLALGVEAEDGPDTPELDGPDPNSLVNSPGGDGGVGGGRGAGAAGGGGGAEGGREEDPPPGGGPALGGETGSP